MNKDGVTTDVTFLEHNVYDYRRCTRIILSSKYIKSWYESILYRIASRKSRRVDFLIKFSFYKIAAFKPWKHVDLKPTWSYDFDCLNNISRRNSVRIPQLFPNKIGSIVADCKLVA